jgi:transcriptional regulator with XRE-family HTH domain
LGSPLQVVKLPTYGYLMAQTGKVHRFGLSDRLRVAREGAGLSQTALAKEAGICRQSVQNYESGSTTAKTHILIAWAVITGFDYDWLRTGVYDAPAADSDDDESPELRLVAMAS